MTRTAWNRVLERGRPLCRVSMSGLCEHRWVGFGSPYSFRNENLRLMGFKSYRAYLKSALWAQIRASVLAENERCVVCGKREATQVHHRAYDRATLEGKHLTALSALCAKCHRKGEKPEWLRQDPHERLGRINHMVMKASRKHDQRKRNQFSGTEAPPPRPSKSPKKFSAFAVFEPRLVKRTTEVD